MKIAEELARDGIKFEVRNAQFEGDEYYNLGRLEIQPCGDFCVVYNGGEAIEFSDIDKLMEYVRANL